MPPPIAPPLPAEANMNLDTRVSEENTQGDGSRSLNLINYGFLTTNQIAILRFCHEIQPILQDGPSCGLAALCMAASILKENDKALDLKEVLEVSRSKGYTTQGEMFSVDNMASLAASQIKGHASILEDGLRDRRRVVAHLLRGHPVLVPYDADGNHEPCLRNGHKAHWAVLTGVAIILPESELENLRPRCELKRDPVVSNVYHVSANTPTELLMARDLSDIRVYSRQGKSRKVHLWSYDSLSSSNENLFEISPIRKDPLDKYTVPDGGIRKGLCGRAVLLGP